MPNASVYNAKGHILIESNGVPCTSRAGERQTSNQHHMHAKNTLCWLPAMQDFSAWMIRFFHEWCEVAFSISLACLSPAVSSGPCAEVHRCFPQAGSFI